MGAAEGEDDPAEPCKEQAAVKWVVDKAIDTGLDEFAMIDRVV